MKESHSAKFARRQSDLACYEVTRIRDWRISKPEEAKDGRPINLEEIRIR